MCLESRGLPTCRQDISAIRGKAASFQICLSMAVTTVPTNFYGVISLSSLPAKPSLPRIQKQGCCKQADGLSQQLEAARCAIVHLHTQLSRASQQQQVHDRCFHPVMLRLQHAFVLVVL